MNTTKPTKTGEAAMTTYTVLLEDDTVGDINSDTLDGQSAVAFIGEIVNVHLCDENGNEIERQGRLIEVLDETQGWE